MGAPAVEAPAAVQLPAAACAAAGASGGRESPRTIIGVRLCLAEAPAVPAAARWLSSAAAAAALTAGVMLATAALDSVASAAGLAGNHAVVSPAARAAAAPLSGASTAGDSEDAAGAATACSSALHLAAKRAWSSRTWAVRDLRSWERSPSFFAMRELRAQRDELAGIRVWLASLRRQGAGQSAQLPHAGTGPGATVNTRTRGQAVPRPTCVAHRSTSRS